MPTKKTTKKTSTASKKPVAKKAPPKKAAVKKSAPKKASKSTTKKTSKTTTKKAAAKKSPTKKSATSATKKPTLPKAADHESFWVTSGTILNDLESLADALDSMEKKVFSYHVSKDKNDFADWVEAVLTDTDCAKALRKCKTPNAAKTVVVTHIKRYNV